MGLKVIALEDIEFFSNRTSTTKVKASIRRLADNLGASAPVLFDVFCIYPVPDADIPDE